MSRVPNATTQYSARPGSQSRERILPPGRHGLVLVGSGSFVAFHAGWLEAVARLRPNFEPDVYSGSSGGVWPAVILSQHSTFRAGALAFASFWRKNVRQNVDIYRENRWRRTRNNRPLRDLVNASFYPCSPDKQLRFATVNTSTGLETTWTETSLITSGPVFASFAHPLGLTSSDTASVTEAPLKPAIDAGADILDVVLVDPDRPVPGDLRAEDQVFPDIDISRVRYVNSMVQQGADTAHRRIDIRVHRPFSPLMGHPMNFDGDITRKNSTSGAEVATSWLMAVR